MKLAILDRIGTLNIEGEDSIVALKDWVLQEGVLDAVAQLNRGGWHVTLATNQPGLGRGSFDLNDLNAIHLRMQRELAAVGARIEAVFFCPHTPEEGCSCRKPAPGLLQQIAARYGAEPDEIWVVGQDTKHLEAGEAIGAHVVWLQLGETAPLNGVFQDVPRYVSWKALADALAPDVQTPPAAPRP
ncbi:D-glycero-alpha-D-manno-heptose-1,7-bisphosphate 7-phosphatase [Comamonas sp. NoAH]|uniref:D-glycero-alpha-D-manno-heptose-1,7-bisphosphate 7-phosphatase n=1 Tax=Comamonas halotolerans TaxID=3041496 RepID=UPI0024E0BF97|nr:HAD-IIIA family hydrolase [Comamonas sp. NoAH]